MVLLDRLHTNLMRLAAVSTKRCRKRKSRLRSLDLPRNPSRPRSASYRWIHRLTFQARFCCDWCDTLILRRIWLRFRQTLRGVLRGLNLQAFVPNIQAEAAVEAHVHIG